jgi:DNA-binding transcriptional MocR family regulator
LYRQLHREVAKRIRAGEIDTGTRLPSVRGLAKTLSISPITVVQAYNALAADGLIHATVGRGTFAGGFTPEPPTARDAIHTAEMTIPRAPQEEKEDFHSATPVHLRAPRISAMQALLRPARRPGVISLAGGTPDPSLFPLRSLGRLWSRVMALENPRFLQYGSPQGDYHLRLWIAQHCESIGIKARPEDILVTSGSQQAIDLVARTFIGPGDFVLVESPTFITALDIIEGRGAKLAGIPMDKDGPRMDVATSLVERYRPRLIYTIPTAHNPTGTTMTEDRRRRMADLGRRHNLLVLEDDICSEFAYDGEAPPPVKAYDTSGHVIFILSFSKTVIPGLRVGCVVAHGPIMARLIEAKLLADRFTSPLIQRTLWRYLSSRQYPRDLQTARDTYRRRRDAVLRALKGAMPQEVTWTHPSAGFNMWIHLPNGLLASDVFEEGLKEGVACAMGDLCLPHVPPPSGLRISFADSHEDVVADGIKRLARSITRLMSLTRGEDRDAEFVTTV